MIVSWNGSLEDAEGLKVSAFDSMLLRGEGVFETVLVEDGEPCLWEGHWGRLQAGVRMLGFALPTEEFLRRQISEVLTANSLSEARVRLTVGANVLVTAEPLGQWPELVKAVTSRFAVNELSPLMGVKCTSYAENMWVLRHAEMEEAIRPNSQGELCEGCLSNVFFVKGERIYTPSLDSGCLPGVMRAEVMRLTTVQEGRWPMEFLGEVDEVWVSNSIRKLRRVCELDGRALNADGGFFTDVLAQL